MGKIKLDVWDYILWLSVILFLGWAFLKSIGIINTPNWVLMIPYFAAGLALLGFVFKAGKISQSIETMGEDIKDLKTKTGEIDTSLNILSGRVALREETIERIDGEMKEFINSKK